LATLDELWRISKAAGIDAPDGDECLRKGAKLHWTIQIALLMPPLMIAMVALLIFADRPLVPMLLLALLLVITACLFWCDWRKYRFGLDDQQLYLQRGWWQQQLTLAPQVKVQSIEIAQGPLARRCGLASLKFGIAGGTLEMVALPLPMAREIRSAVMEKVAEVDYSAINQSR
jgi:putative membrane protein